MTRQIILAVLLVASASAAGAQALLRVDPNRATDLIAADLDIPAAVFVACFSGVSPGPDHDPTGATQRANKAVLLPGLQAEDATITNDRLDAVMDRPRPKAPMRRP